MIQTQQLRQSDAQSAFTEAAEIVSEVARIYVEFNDKGRLVKSRSSLPCSWIMARECMMTAYEVEYPDLSEDLQNSYHHIYRELSFFVEDDLCNEFNAALNIAARCRHERLKKMGISQDESFCRIMLASCHVTVLERREIWDRLACEETCPRQHLLLLAETLSFCSGTYRAMWDEWAAFANLIAYRRKNESDHASRERCIS